MWLAAAAVAVLVYVVYKQRNAAAGATASTRSVLYGNTGYAGTVEGAVSATTSAKPAAVQATGSQVSPG